MPAFIRFDDRTRRTVRAAAVLLFAMGLAAAASAAAYVVKPGDTLGGIAAANNTTVSAIVTHNEISNPNRIRAGQTLQIHGRAAGAAATKLHTVRYGEILSGIAASHNVSLAALLNANAIPNSNRIQVGQVISIPGAGTTGGTAPLVHLVQRGESLASIAAKYGVSVSSLAANNGMTPTSTIFVTTRLRVSPAPPTFTPVDSGSGVYVVAAGDTLGGIAARQGISVHRLLDLNGLANPDLIRTGQRLTVPGGGWVCPVPGATFFNDWGFPRNNGRVHEGNDLFAPRGTPVLAPEAGFVEQITGTIGGLQFRLTTANGTVYWGTHLDSFGAGGQVSAGTVVGYVGDSGNAKGARPMLHFEVHPRGIEPINPYPLLAEACG